MESASVNSLYALIDAFRTGGINATRFAGEFERLYNLKVDRREFTPVERDAFAELFEKVVWYSPFPEERRQIANYLGEEDVVRAVESAAKSLDMARKPGREDA